MRIAAVLFSLGLVASVLAAPAPGTPLLFAKDPMSIHRRSPVPEPVPVSPENVHVNDRNHASTSSAPIIAVVEDNEEEPSEEACVSICGIRRVEGAKNEREALCSVNGLKATLDCAQCIDTTWPDTTWEDSAMAEYHRIVDACDDTPVQQVMHRS